mmetsp:Transcript_697/g.1595  ORF Transcript_697/g.1595 Transcript_697/m.1595 type:complete len:227 (+) Transcript_697:530-1210(+)
MMREPPGCSGSQLVTSSTMESRTSRTWPHALAATTSSKRKMRTPLDSRPSLSWQYSSRARRPRAVAALAMSSMRCRDQLGGGLPRCSASRNSSTRSNVRVSTSTLTLGALDPLSRTTFVSAMQGLSSFFLTGNHSASRVYTFTTSVGAGRAAWQRTLVSVNTGADVEGAPGSAALAAPSDRERGAREAAIPSAVSPLLLLLPLLGSGSRWVRYTFVVGPTRPRKQW